jgi:hypothetical protein
VDASVAKNFTLREALRLQLIVQAFNAFNHVNLANPDTCINCQDLNSIGVENAGTTQGTVANAGRNLHAPPAVRGALPVLIRHQRKPLSLSSERLTLI